MCGYGVVFDGKTLIAFGQSIDHRISLRRLKATARKNGARPVAAGGWGPGRLNTIAL